ncbi:hypothetical protein I7I48_01979 [Histoplasma ohiense]|nr:hypothetical protein I7I48_01979 [Histoplasma ohiense (nom. inval.)]
MQGMPVPTSIPPGIHICTWFYYLLFLHFIISGLCGLCLCYNALPKWYPYSYDFITVSSRRKRRGVKMEHPGYFCPHTISPNEATVSSRTQLTPYHQRDLIPSSRRLPSPNITTRQPPNKAARCVRRRKMNNPKPYGNAGT